MFPVVDMTESRSAQSAHQPDPVQPVDLPVEDDLDVDEFDDLEGALDETSDWGESGYADEDPEESAGTGAYELAERHALRRVAGLSTELADITEVEYRQLRLERVVLVGVWTEGSGRGRRELAGRAGRAGRDRRLAGARRADPAPRQPDPATYIGSRQGRRAARRRRWPPAPTP